MHEQLLAANHFVMGTTNILLIAIPDGWQLQKGHSAPEVDHWVDYGGRRWLTRGEAPYRLIQPHPANPRLVRADVELMVHVRSAESKEIQGASLTGKGEAGSLEIGGHTAAYRFGTISRGLLPRREVAALQISLTCHETMRRLYLAFAPFLRDGSPTATQADLAELLAALQTGFTCH